MKDKKDIAFYEALRYADFSSSEAIEAINKHLAETMCYRHRSQYKDDCGYCKDEANKG